MVEKCRYCGQEIRPPKPDNSQTYVVAACIVGAIVLGLLMLNAWSTRRQSMLDLAEKGERIAGGLPDPPPVSTNAPMTMEDIYNDPELIARRNYEEKQLVMNVKATMAMYDAIYIGMSQSDVWTITGGRGLQKSYIEVPPQYDYPDGYTVEGWQWQGNGGPSSSMFIKFQAQQVWSKHQSGLR